MVWAMVLESCVELDVDIKSIPTNNAQKASKSKSKLWVVSDRYLSTIDFTVYCKVLVQPRSSRF
jgi:hypothetical protein